MTTKVKIINEGPNMILVGLSSLSADNRTKSGNTKNYSATNLESSEEDEFILWENMQISIVELSHR